MEEENQQKPPTPVPATELPQPTENPKIPTQNPSSLPPLPPNHTAKKRKLADNVDTNSKCFKIRAIVKDLRPNFIEVLRTPDFRNSKAAEEIKTKMNLLIVLYKQLVSETVSTTTCNSGVQSLPGESKVEQIPLEKLPEEKLAAQPQPPPQPDQIPQKVSEPTLDVNNSNSAVQDVMFEGTYVVGGSNFGWNFIMHPGGKPVYYGVTRESRKLAKEPCSDK
ncbi:uncharacterized protein LOC113274597 [Papaver somniferum]|uniref:uncharacterized protein LOC113274597 n=1 Tax=Papaver somniferum TaxID=3469 RepID=UPI000E6FBD49|nr:uncharacterized protein LOC113274597 [Papaver somniferum]